MLGPRTASLQGVLRAASGRIPEPHQTVLSGAGQTRAVSVPGERRGAQLVTCQDSSKLSSSTVEQTDRSTDRGSSEPAAIGRPRQGNDVIADLGMPLHG